MGRHAYLIIAYNQKELLCKQLRCLDHERNDFFVHLDKKSKIKNSEIESSIQKGRIFFTERVRVTWGGDTLIKAELRLLEMAVSTGEHDFYHLLSGVDFPLYDQETILDFFDRHADKTFLSFWSKITPYRTEWVKFYYPMQNYFNRRNIAGKAIRRTGMIVQRALRVDRGRKTQLIYGGGSNWFDIRDSFAREIVADKERLWKVFRNTFCGDERFVQTLWLTNHHKQSELYTAPNHGNPYIHDNLLDVKRAIDWTRSRKGTPYVWKIEDYTFLKQSGCLFARKFDYQKYPEIIDKLEKEILKPEES